MATRPQPGHIYPVLLFDEWSEQVAVRDVLDKGCQSPAHARAVLRRHPTIEVDVRKALPLWWLIHIPIFPQASQLRFLEAVSAYLPT